MEQEWKEGKGEAMETRTELTKEVKQIFNPYLPEYEYIPDGEPHVFEGRVYVYGSHDRFDGKKFCMNDYVCYSADLRDLTDWKYEGVIYRRNQDPRMADGTHYLWAPDVVRGKDGRYYLYYCPDDTIRSIGVAVCDTPAGKYEFLGIVKDEKGNPVGEREGDTIAFDPGVLLDEDGTVYLYSGNGPRTEAAIGKEPKGSRVMTLKEDMVTLMTEPRKLLPVLGESRGTGFEGHEFFEASSIRKINGLYYLVYSSVVLHELCYAYSSYPDRDFIYGGVIVSNADLSEKKKEDRPKNCFGNNHGGIVCIDNQYYIFYHRQTNQTMFSRQGCAEKIRILQDGSIPQAEMTSCGLNRGALKDSGTYPASMVCNLYGRQTPVSSNPKAMEGRHPFLTQDGPDYDPEETDRIPPRQYITNGEDGMTALFRYFDFRNVNYISVKVRGSMKGKLVLSLLKEGESPDEAELPSTKEKKTTDMAELSLTKDGEAAGEIELFPSEEWTEFGARVKCPKGKRALCFQFYGSGKMDFLEFILHTG